MSIKSFFICCFCLGLLAACKQSNTSSLGYKFDVLTKGTGNQLKVGDFAYFNVITKAGDSVLEDTHIYPNMPVMRIEAKPNRQIAAIMDAMKEMHVGDSIKVHIPMDSLPFAPATLQSFKEIVHLITLNSINTEEGYKKDMANRNTMLQHMADSLARLDSTTKIKLLTTAKDYSAKKLDGQLKDLGNGLKFIPIVEGNGAVPNIGDIVEVNYYGCLPNGTVFDESFNKGQPYIFRIKTGEVIKGWDEGISKLKEGTEGYLFVPSDLAYGKTGQAPSIPPDAELIFYVNLYKVRSLKK